MRQFNRITIWENRKRVARLRAFRAMVESYFSGLGYSMGRPYPIRDNVPELRRKLNESLAVVGDIVAASDTNQTVLYRAAPASGGWTTRLDLLHNLFRLHELEIPHDDALDAIDKSIGVYQGDHQKAWIRSFNPLFYASLVFEWIASVPFKVIAILGFDRRAAEASRAGRLFKGIGQLVLWVLAVLKAIQELGWLDDLSAYVTDVAQIR